MVNCDVEIGLTKNGKLLLWEIRLIKNGKLWLWEIGLTKNGQAEYESMYILSIFLNPCFIVYVCFSCRSSLLSHNYPPSQSTTRLREE
jgi:hypothetical protein